MTGAAGFGLRFLGGTHMFIKGPRVSGDSRAVGLRDGALKAAIITLFTFKRCPSHPFFSASSKYPITLCQDGKAVMSDRSGCSKQKKAPQAQERRANIDDLEARMFPSST